MVATGADTKQSVQIGSLTSMYVCNGDPISSWMPGHDQTIVDSQFRGRTYRGFSYNTSRLRQRLGARTAIMMMS